MPLVVALEAAAVLLGLLAGSFLNVCISRLPQHRSVARPRSHCLHCEHTIRWYDNIPLLSWFALRGRCRDCDAPISSRYPAVELAAGLWFAVVFWFNFHPLLAATADTSGVAPEALLNLLLSTVTLAVFGFLLLGLSVMDWQTHLLPDTFTLSGILLGFLLTCTQAAFLPYGSGDIKLNPHHGLRMSSPGSFAAKGNVFLTGTESVVFGRMGAIIGAALLLLAIRWFYFALRGRRRQIATEDVEADAIQGRYGLGLGDVKLLAMIAAFLGFWPAVLALFVGVLGCTAYALLLLARRRASLLTQVPLGSFLCFGGLMVALFGESWLAWYRSLL